MSLPRSLPIRLAPVRGEPLDSWLDAYAHRLDTSLGEVYAAVGLHTPTRRAWSLPGCTVVLHDDEANALAIATGVAVNQLHAMTLRTYHGHAVLLNLQRREVRRFYLWGRGRGSRFCPQCLRESGGRWRLRWRLAWSFACTRHNQLLADTCPRCGRPPRTKRTTINRIPVLGQCAEYAAAAAEGDRCGYPFQHVPPAPLEQRSPLLTAQHWIDQHLAVIESRQLAPGALRGTFDDLRAVAGRVLLTAQPDDADTHGGHVAEQWRNRVSSNSPSRRPGTWPPTSAAVTAVALATAVTVLLDGPESLTTLQRLMRRDHARGMARTQLKYHAQIGVTSPELRRRVWKAMDSDLRPVDRLRYRTVLDNPREPSRDPQLLRRRARRLPQQLWPGWTLRLLPADTEFRYDYVRHVLAVAVLLVGKPDLGIDQAKWLLGNAGSLKLGNTIHHLGQHQPVGAVLRTLCELADYLDNTTDGIDYQQRRDRVGPGLLSIGAWTSICQELDLETQHGDRYVLTRLYLYQRLTGTPFAAAPPRLRITDYAWSRYKLRIDRLIDKPLMDCLDDYAAEYLNRRGIANEAVIWEPPLDLIDAELLTRDTLQQQVREAQQEIATGATRISEVANAIGCSARRTRLLLQHHPPAPQRPEEMKRS